MLPAYPKQSRLTLSPLGRNQVGINIRTNYKASFPCLFGKKTKKRFLNGPGDKANSHAYSGSTAVLRQLSPDATGV